MQYQYQISMDMRGRFTQDSGFDWFDKEKQNFCEYLEWKMLWY